MFCRFCGKQILDDSIFCAYCGKKLDGAPTNNDTFDYSWLDMALNKSNEHRAKLSKARALVITGKYPEAIDIYNELIDNDPSDISGYIGLLRVTSRNFTSLNGTYNFQSKSNGAWTYLTVASCIDTISKLLNGLSSGDNEFEDFMKRYKENLEQQEKLRREQEAQRQAELERKKREAEEAEKRKPEELKEALRAFNEAVKANNNDSAFKSFSLAIRLANDLKTTLPDDVLKGFGEACRHYSSESRNNPLIMNYFTKLAEAGNPTAQYYLGYIYMWGKATYQSYDRGYSHPEAYEAEKWYRMAANNGSPEAICIYGDRYYDRAKKISGYDDSDVKKRNEEYVQALYWYQRAMDKGSVPATLKIAELYRYGYGVARNTSKALELYQKTNSYAYVASIYEIEFRNINEAIYWYKKANNNLKVGKLYESLGNKSEAIKHYRMCVEGVPYPSDEAQKLLAKLLYN